MLNSYSNNNIQTEQIIHWMLSKKAGMKWSIELFLCILIVTAGVILVVLFFPGLFAKQNCPRAQELEIKKVWNKVKEVKGRPGYEIVYFKMKDCVTEIKYEESDEMLKVQYTTTENPIEYPTNADWFPDKLEEPGTYTLRVFSDRVELVSS